MTSTSTFGMESMNYPPINGFLSAFYKPRFVKRICMNSHLNVISICYLQGGINSSRSSTPVFVDF